MIYHLLVFSVELLAQQNLYSLHRWTITTAGYPILHYQLCDIQLLFHCLHTKPVLLHDWLLGNMIATWITIQITHTVFLSCYTTTISNQSKIMVTEYLTVDKWRVIEEISSGYLTVFSVRACIVCTDRITVFSYFCHWISSISCRLDTSVFQSIHIDV